MSDVAVLNEEISPSSRLNEEATVVTKDALRERVLSDDAGMMHVWLRVREPAVIWNRVALKLTELGVSKNLKYSNEHAVSLLVVMVKRGRGELTSVTDFETGVSELRSLETKSAEMLSSIDCVSAECVSGVNKTRCS